MIFRVETDLVINPDGSFDEISGTPPDIEFPGPATFVIGYGEDMLEDTWVQKIINDL